VRGRETPESGGLGTGRRRWCAELDHLRALALEAQRNVGGVPGVVGDLAHVEHAAVLEDPLLDRAVIDHVARGGFDEALASPKIVGHAITLGTPAQVLRRHEVAREHPPRLALLLGRKDPRQRRHIGGG
jgi:hypothetical protein